MDYFKFFSHLFPIYHLFCIPVYHFVYFTDYFMSSLNITSISFQCVESIIRCILKHVSEQKSLSLSAVSCYFILHNLQWYSTVIFLSLFTLKIFLFAHLHTFLPLVHVNFSLPSCSSHFSLRNNINFVS